MGGGGGRSGCFDPVLGDPTSTLLLRSTKGPLSALQSKKSFTNNSQKYHREIPSEARGCYIFAEGQKNQSGLSFKFCYCVTITTDRGKVSDKNKPEDRCVEKESSLYALSPYSL